MTDVISDCVNILVVDCVRDMVLEGALFIPSDNSVANRYLDEPEGEEIKEIFLFFSEVITRTVRRFDFLNRVRERVDRDDVSITVEVDAMCPEFRRCLTEGAWDHASCATRRIEDGVLDVRNGKVYLTEEDVYPVFLTVTMRFGDRVVHQFFEEYIQRNQGVFTSYCMYYNYETPLYADDLVKYMTYLVNERKHYPVRMWPCDNGHLDGPGAASIYVDDVYNTTWTDVCSCCNKGVIRDVRHYKFRIVRDQTYQEDRLMWAMTHMDVTVRGENLHDGLTNLFLDVYPSSFEDALCTLITQYVVDV